MFSLNKDKGTSATKASTGHNNIVIGSLIEGNLRSTTDIRLDGRLIGDLECSAKLIVGPKAIVEGNIICESAVIQGEIKGNLQVNYILDLKSTAKIDGDIITQKIVIENGAIFNGACKMQKAESKK